MVYLYLVGGIAIIVASFIVGALYGRKSERVASNYLRSVLDSADKKVE